MAVITTDKPPLYLLQSELVNLTDAWTTVYEVPEYAVTSPVPEQPNTVVKAVATATKLLTSNTSAQDITVSYRITRGLTVVTLTNQVLVPQNDAIELLFQKVSIESGDVFEGRVDTAGQTADLSFSYVLNTRETFSGDTRYAQQ